MFLIVLALIPAVVDIIGSNRVICRMGVPHSKEFPSFGLGVRLISSPRLDHNVFHPFFSLGPPFQFTINSIRFKRLRQFVWIPHIKLLLKTTLLQIVSKGFLDYLQILRNGISARMSVCLENFHDFINIFDHWTTRACLIFDVNITRTEELKPTLCSCI